MATRTDLTSDINLINDGGLNTALEVRTLAESLTNESYGNIFFGSNFSSGAYPEITTQIVSNVTYKVDFVKQGHILHVNGYISNTSGALLEDQPIFNVVGAEFTSIFQNNLNARADSGSITRLTYNGSLLTAKILAYNENYYFNGFIILTN